jgi:hypothetical protein
LFDAQASSTVARKENEELKAKLLALERSHANIIEKMKNEAEYNMYVKAV